ncbi:hypothetical protein EW146_g8128 [Bondarzewia mesenterica]|uniref:Uncharacterized protein n=1 Tax=Bondarzewia mesenterica TaxID=1095465 RepID=A0A4S4LHI0_9AGAM|nr:hypothetical protein EW146_g8128 [Bondarzewia mesenterica]
MRRSLTADMAVELESLVAWKRALEEGGFIDNAMKKKKALDEAPLLISIRTTSVKVHREVSAAKICSVSYGTTRMIDVVSVADRLKDLLLTSPIVYGFGLIHKQWLEFNAENVRPIQWNEEAFKNLALESEQKILVQSHAQDRPMDDFIEGNGLGLVINLFVGGADGGANVRVDAPFPRTVSSPSIPDPLLRAISALLFRLTPSSSGIGAWARAWAAGGAGPSREGRIEPRGLRWPMSLRVRTVMP